MTSPNDPNQPSNYDPNFNPNFNPNFGPHSPYGQQYPFPPQPVGKPMTWQEVWTSAVTEPNERTYWEIIVDPQASLNRAIAWIVSAFCASFVLGVVANFLVSPINQSAFSEAFVGNRNVVSTQPTNFFSTETQIGFIICAAPFAIVIMIVLLAIVTGIFHFIARLFGGGRNL